VVIDKDNCIVRPVFSLPSPTSPSSGCRPFSRMRGGGCFEASGGHRQRFERWRVGDEGLVPGSKSSKRIRRDES
jgi:hypothetical protein